ncbi:MAG: YndJ family transporter [Opitutaceae bacterium]
MKTRTQVLIGAGVFGAYALRAVPDLRHGAWGEALLLFAAGVLVPIVLDLLPDKRDDALTARWLTFVRRLQFAAVLSLLFAYLLPPGIFASLAAVPWACVLVILALVGGRRVLSRGLNPVSLLCRDLGLMYAAIGAVWLLSDRLGFRPLGFDPAIVLLTAVHFHYAGLLLPVLTGLALAAMEPKRLFSFIGLGVIAGVPAVAIGITATQLRLDPRIELGATLVMALSGLCVAMLYLRLAMQARWPAGARVLWLTAGLSLAAGMVLAVLYGVRYFFHPFPWVDLPWMRALHGSANALGFGLCGVLGWRFCGEKYVSLAPRIEKNA